MNTGTGIPGIVGRTSPVGWSRAALRSLEKCPLLVFERSGSGSSTKGEPDRRPIVLPHHLVYYPVR